MFKRPSKTATAADFLAPPFCLMTSVGTPKVVALSHIRIAVLVSVDVQTAFGLASNQFCVETAPVQVEILSGETLKFSIKEPDE